MNKISICKILVGSSNNFFFGLESRILPSRTLWFLFIYVYKINDKQTHLKRSSYHFVARQRALVGRRERDTAMNGGIKILSKISSSFYFWKYGFDIRLFFGQK